MKLSFKDIGKDKRLNWIFQEEYRFSFMCMPISINEMASLHPYDQFPIIISGVELPKEGYFLKLNNEAFSKTEVTLGARASEGQKVIVEALINRFNPDAILKDSNLKAKIRIK